MGMGSLLLVAGLLGGPAPAPAVGADVVEAVVAALVARHGAAEEARIRRGVAQVAARWWPEDGDAAAFRAFCGKNYLASPAERSAVFARLEEVLEQVDGHLLEVRRELLRPQDLDLGPIAPVDLLLGNLDLAAHVDEDLFRTRPAFLALLNFPVTTLAEKLADGPSWDRATWAAVRMTDRFAQRVPAAVLQGVTAAFTAADQYIAAYYLRMDRLRSADGAVLFPEGLRLISHWGLRDELKSQYAAGPAGLPRQQLIFAAMKRIVRQEIPVAVVDNGDLDWWPGTNEVRAHAGAAVPLEGLGTREPDTRFARMLGVFHAVREVDPYTPTAPSYIRRRFEQDRQIPEAEVEALLVSVLESAEVSALAERVAARLGRPLAPFDIWYPGFTPRAALPGERLDAIVRAKYPTREAVQTDLPRLLQALGFAPARAAWLAERIAVDPARGAGHAMGALRREDAAHLRTQIRPGGMVFQGFNVAMHELGHSCEQAFSLGAMDHWFLNGVPNTAFTEAFAFVFQGRDLEMLGLAPPRATDRALAVLNDLWMTYEIAGVSLVDMQVWRWLYAHPAATPAELREAVLAAAREVWNRFFAPRFGVRDEEILAIYSHMISSGLYLPDYALGHIIAFQVAQALRGGDFGADFERMARLGRLTPDAWMRAAVGGPLSAGALLDAARAALAQLP